ncbi:MAG: GNAT family N-acetyltransferase [Bacteroidota bacterium]|nr:GNAT family N-acetyltransferase [Bacteroidota bacterium]MDP4248108.1 GNAT family N-acetyltransferase [Bacteroidota bacterium]MDP4252504.1 GNAT family N-acetyltransferase [Bacteroidota bacterium]
MTMIDSATRVHSDRLVLLPVSDEYKLEICHEFTAEVTRYMPFNPTGDIKMTEAFLEDARQEMQTGEGVHFCILNKETNEFLGVCGIHNMNTRGIEIGLWIKISRQASGFGTETVGALLDFVRLNLSFDYVSYPVDKDNLASRKIPEKFGFIPFKTYEKNKSREEVLHIIEYRRANETAVKIP